MKKILYLVLIALPLALFSCGGGDEQPTPDPTSGTGTEPEPEPMTAVEYLQSKLEASEHFTKYTNPNGVVSYVLTTHIAKNQITMYFTTPTVTDDGRYIWIWLTAGEGSYDLAVFDVERDELRHYDGMQVHTSTSYVDTATGEVYWIKPADKQAHVGDYYYLASRGPKPEDRIKLVSRIPHLVEGPTPRQVATALTRSADKKYFAFDSGHYRSNNKTYFGAAPTDIDEDAVVWASLERRYNHAQMHTVHNDVMLACQDYFTDYNGQFGVAGGRVEIDNRMWIVYSDGQAAPVFPKGNDIYHEWWDASGDYLWYIDKKGNQGGHGVCKVPYTYSTRSFGTPQLVWPMALGHAMGSKSGLYLVGDHGHKYWETTGTIKVSFYNPSTTKEVDIATDMPYSGYQNDPHPTFAMNDGIVCYTFATEECNSYAITFTDKLIEKSK